MKILKMFLLIYIIFIVLSCGNKSFKKVKNINTKYNVIISGFESDKYGISIGLANGDIYCTTNGGKNWQNRSILINLFGLEILNEKIAFISGLTGHSANILDVRKITEGGVKWDYVNDNIMDIIISNKCFYISFINETIGWLASDKQICLTKDGKTWTDVSLPSDFNRIAAINLISENNSNENGIILDDNGNLFRTTDSGMTWNKKNLNLKTEEKIYLSLKGNSNYIRFKDINTGLIVVALEKPEKKILIFKTNDGGNSFLRESIDIDFKTPVYTYISRDLNFITISFNKKIICYKNSKS